MKRFIILSSIVISGYFRCSGTEYICFSLSEAKNRILQLAPGQDYRVVYPDIYRLGNMTVVKGLVYDATTNDIIIVGERNAERQPITLDDFVIALRARFLYKSWPLVSIDPNDQMEATGMLSVRFEGHVENTKFGQDLLDADYILKKLAFGIYKPDIPGLNSYFDLNVSKYEGHSLNNNKSASRFWFFPILPQVLVRNDVVSIRELKIGVFTEVLSASVDDKKIEDLTTFQDQAGNEFAKLVSESFLNLTKVYASFNRLQSLEELVALTKAIEEMKVVPDFHFWISEFHVKSDSTPTQMKLIAKEQVINPQSNNQSWILTIKGGVQLMAIALRLSAGDISALKDAALKTRPKNAVFWSFFHIGDWVIAGNQNLDDPAIISELFAQAVFLIHAKRYDDALLIYEKIEHLSTLYRPQATFEKAILLRLKGSVEGAEAPIIKSNELFEETSEHYPEFYADCKYQLAVTADAYGSPNDAIKYYNQALTNNANAVSCYLGLGLAYYKLEEDALCRVNLQKYLEYDSSSEYAMRAKTILHKISK